jgi:chromosome segregation ATPase
MYSEQQMKEFFQNIVDQVATLSTQAEKVQGLEQRILNMSDRLRELEEQNRQTVQELHDTQSALSRVQRDLEVTQQDLHSERAVIASLRETIVQRDAGVQNLEQGLRSEQDAHKITTSERDDARRRGEELTEQVNSFRTQLEHAKEVSQGWQERAYKAEAEAAEYKQQLDKINSLINPLRVVSGDVQASG